MSDEYRPRPDDELVEPLFGGISAAQEKGAQAADRGTRLRSFLTWLALAMALAGAILWWI